MNTPFRPTLSFEGYLDQFDSVEVYPVKEDADHNCEICHKDEANMWSVYLHYKPEHGEGVTCVADFKTREQAYLYGDALEKILEQL